MLLALLPLLLVDSAFVFRVQVAPAESVRVTVIGAGSPVILVPGLFGSSYGFRRVIPGLVAAGYGALVVEPLGIGGSGRPSGADYSLTAQAGRIAAVLDTLGVSRAIVVAHSTAASMAYRLAYRRPDLVRGLVSLDGGPVEVTATAELRRAMRFAPWIRLFGGVALIRRKIRRTLVAASGDTSWVDSAAVAAYTDGAAHDLGGTLRAYVRMAGAREPERLAPHLRQIRCPVRLVIGTAPHDGGIRAAEVEVLRRSLASFAVDTVIGAGLFLHEERPETVVGAVLRLDAADRD